MNARGLVDLTAGAGWVLGRLPGRSTKTEGIFPADATGGAKVGGEAGLEHQHRQKDADVQVLPEYELARALVRSEFPLLIVTGGARTGKSTCQGKTLDRVHIDLGAGAFETGQTYVALSRCRSLSRLTLSRPLTTEDVRVDVESQAFYEALRRLIETTPLEKMREHLRSGGRNPRRAT